MGLTCNVANLVNGIQLARAIAAFEPHVPWTKPFLELRLRAYAKSGHRLVAIAERDLLRFQVNSGAVGEVAESKGLSIFTSESDDCLSRRAAAD